MTWQKLNGCYHRYYEAFYRPQSYLLLSVCTFSSRFISLFAWVFQTATYVDVDSESFFSVIGTDNGTRGHDLKLYTNYCRVNVRKHFFCSRIIAVWNALKMNPCNTKTLKAFKIFLKNVDLSEYLHVFRKWRMSMVLYFSVYFFKRNICFTVFWCFTFLSI